LRGRHPPRPLLRPLPAPVVPHRPASRLERDLRPPPRIQRERLRVADDRLPHHFQRSPVDHRRRVRSGGERGDAGGHGRRRGRPGRFEYDAPAARFDGGNRIEGATVTDIYIVNGVRTPMAEYNGHFSDISAIDLAVVAAKEALSRSGTAAEEIDHVIVGNALQTSGDAIYGARHVGLKAGVPREVPALTVNRLCGSGIQSIINAAEQIQLGEAKTVLAGGMENMSQAPHVIRGARKGLRLGQAPMEDSLMVALLDTYAGLYMAQTAENLARKYEIPREEQDRFALRSQQCAAEAAKSGRLQEEIVPVAVGRKGEQVKEDDHVRPDTTME